MLEAFLAEEASAIKSVTQSSQVERVFSEFEPDLMLLDLHMPAPDGLEILRNLRSVRESLGFLPVIVLTGDTGDVARNIEEHDSLKQDMQLISVVCTLAVLFIIVLFFRSLASIPYLFFPTLLGVAMSFATAALTIHLSG